MKIFGSNRKLMAGVAAMAFAISCTTAATPPAGSGAPIVGGTVNFRLRSGVGTLDISKTQLTQTAGVVSASLYDTLTATDPKNGDPIPYLAKSWSKDANSITFTLRTDATCTDGTKITPTVVKNSLDAYIKSSPAVAISLGAGPFTVTANDAAGTLSVSTATPNSELIYGFSYHGTGIVCPAGLTDLTQQTRKSFGSGPYVIDSVVENDRFTVKLRPDWAWGPQGRTAKTPGIPEIINFKSIENDTTAANLLSAGGLDIADISGPDIERMKADKSLTHAQIANATAAPLLMNQLPGRPFADKALREAAMYAIDLPKYNQAAYLGLAAMPTGGLILKGSRCYDESLRNLWPKYDPAKAKQILTSAGYTLGANGKFNGKDGKPLVINVVGQQIIRSGPEYFAESLSAIGLTTTLRNLVTVDYSATVRRIDFDIVPFTTSSPSATLAGFLPYVSGGKLVTEGGLNRSGVNDPVINKAYSDYLAAGTPADECRFMNQVQTLLFQSFYTMPLLAPTFEWFSRNITIPSSGNYPVAWMMLRTK